MGTGTVKHCDAIDLFAGAGGWDLAARDMGLDVLGIELDKDACDTRAAAGLRTHKGDIAALDPADFAPKSGPLQGLIASPPCQAWSTAGKRQGEVDKPNVYELAAAWAAGVPVSAADFEWADDRSPLVAEPIRWARALQPTWMAFEQVPPVLELWREFEAIFRSWGYQTWAGVLSAERYGVPQTRKRAILLAHRDRPVAPPAATHQEFVPGEPAREDHTLEGRIQPWVAIRDVIPRFQGQEGLAARPAPTIVTTRRSDEGIIVGRQLPEGEGRNVGGHGWVPVLRSGNTIGGGERAERRIDEPAVTVTTRADNCEWVYDRRQGSTRADGTRDMVRPVPVPVSEPAPTISSQGLVKGRDLFVSSSGEAIRVSLEEASILQSFPADFPWSGSKSATFLQVGNAIPPGLARAVIGQVADVSAASARTAA